MNKKTFFVLIFILISHSIFCEENIADSAENNEDIDISGITDTEVLWDHLSAVSDSGKKAEILIALGRYGKGNREVIDNLNNYLMSINLSYRAGTQVQYVVISACISSIMELGDSSSYQALFSAVCAGFPEVITSEAFGALEVINGNLYQFLLNVIWNNPPDEKFVAFRIAVNSERFNISQRGQIAELALEQSLASAETNVNLNAMRYASILTLTRIRWTRASSLVIRHYYRVQTDFFQGLVLKDRYIEAINCLGAVGDSQAALVLGLQLGLINARTENTGVYDAEITLAIVRSLGLIGDNAAFDHLLYVSSLSYSEHIKAAAMEAIENLKWGR